MPLSLRVIWLSGFKREKIEYDRPAPNKLAKIAKYQLISIGIIITDSIDIIIFGTLKLEVKTI